MREVIVTMHTSESLGQYKRARLGRRSCPQFRWLFITLTLLSVAPFWTVHYPIITDYPNHLARWFVLHHGQDPLYHFSSLYAPAWGPLPYITSDILAVGLQYVLPIDVVGRCILSFCIVSVALASLFFLKKACPENSNLALFGIVVAFNPNFLMGSIGNQISIAFCLLVVGCWVSYCSSRRVGMALCVLFGLLITYFSHLIGFAVAGIVMGVYALFQKGRWKTLGALGVLSTPALAIFVYNQLRAGSASDLVYAGLTGWEKVRNLLFPIRMFTSWAVDVVVLALLAVVIVLVLMRDRQQTTIQPAWLAVCMVLALVYLVAPGEYRDGGYADVRIMPFLYFFILPVFRFARIPHYLVVGLAMLVLFRVVTVEQMFIVHQRELKQLTLAFNAIPRDAKVLPLVTLEGGRGLVGRGDVHHLTYGIIGRGFLVPTLFHLPGVQPIRLTGSVYCPNVFCFVTSASDAEWRQLELSYDYLWVQKGRNVLPFATWIGNPVFSNEYVTVYHLKHV
jgi:hypothetical protein